MTSVFTKVEHPGQCSRWHVHVGVVGAVAGFVWLHACSESFLGTRALPSLEEQDQRRNAESRRVGDAPTKIKTVKKQRVRQKVKSGVTTTIPDGPFRGFPSRAAYNAHMDSAKVAKKAREAEAAKQAKALREPQVQNCSFEGVESDVACAPHFIDQNLTGIIESADRAPGQGWGSHDEYQTIVKVYASGKSESTRDKSCCRQCTCEKSCQYWIRHDHECWLRRGMQNRAATPTYSYVEGLRGGFNKRAPIHLGEGPGALRHRDHSRRWTDLEHGLQQASWSALGRRGEWVVPGRTPANHFKEMCRRLQKAGARNLVNFETGGKWDLWAVEEQPVLVQRGGWWNQDTFDTLLPHHLLTAAIAALAGIPFAKLSNPNGHGSVPFLSMIEMHPYVPPKPEQPMKLNEAYETVCGCATPAYPHGCSAAGVWEAFQRYWRPQARDGMLEYIHSKATVIETSAFADLAVHVHCGDDALGRNNSQDGFLGLSAYKKALEGLSKAQVKIRIFMVQTSDSGHRGKDATSSMICREVGDGLTQLLRSSLGAANVVLDSTSDVGDVWTHLMFSNRTLCSPSTFCLWPAIAAENSFLADSALFFNKSHPALKGVQFLIDTPLLFAPVIAQGNMRAADIVRWIAEH